MDGSHPQGFAEAPMTFAPGLPSLSASVLAEGPRFRVRSLHLAPGEATSLCSHLHRSEHWVIVAGTAEITLGIRSRLVGEGEAIQIPLGQRALSMWFRRTELPPAAAKRVAMTGASSWAGKFAPKHRLTPQMRVAWPR